jgi:hypothetical protein
MGTLRWTYTGLGPLIPAAIFFGLAFTFHVIASYSLSEADRTSQLAVVTARDLPRVSPSDQVMVNGFIDDASTSGYQGLVIYEEYRARINRDDDDPDVSWYRVTTNESKPAFQLRQVEGVIPVPGGGYELEKRTQIVPLFPHGFGRPRDGDSRYEGFRLGDEVTVLGTVFRRGKQWALEAETVSGGTPEEWVDSAKNTAVAFQVLTWVFLSLGLICPVVGYLRRSPAPPPGMWTKARQEKLLRELRRQARRSQGENRQRPL